METVFTFLISAEMSKKKTKKFLVLLLRLSFHLGVKTKEFSFIVVQH